MATDHKKLLNDVLADVTEFDGSAAVGRFADLRAVTAKVREAKLVLENVPDLNPDFIRNMEADPDFSVNSRRVRLEAIANYCRTAIRFLDSGVLKKDATVVPAPDLASLVGSTPGLAATIERRWLEAQICVRGGAYLAAIVLMGSILEGLLLARAQLDVSLAYQANAAPKNRGGGNVALPEWTLNSLLNVAIELRWLRADRGVFGHALRESRNIVHPWVEIARGMDFDEGTARTSWSVLTAAIEDLVSSIR